LPNATDRRAPTTPRHRLVCRTLSALCLAAGLLACEPATPVLTISSPASGTFTTASSIAIEGSVTGVPVSDLELTVNGAVVPLQADGAFSTTVAVSQSAVLNPFVVRVRKLSQSHSTTQRVMVIGGPAVADGMYSASGIGMRVNDTGLGQLEPVIQTLTNDSFDVEDMILDANPIINDHCVFDIFGLCLGRVDVSATSVRYTGSVGIDLDAVTNRTDLTATLRDLRVNYHVTCYVDCRGYIKASTTRVKGSYDQLPGVPASTINVNQRGDVSVDFTSFDNTFTSGSCTWFLIGDIIEAMMGDVEPLVTDGLVTNLRDPDGSGPKDAPIAAALQSTLASLSIAGPIGDALGVTLDADFARISEDTSGLTYRIDSRVTQPNPGPGAPDQLYALEPVETFPTLGAATPGTNLSYGLGLALSSGTFNQLLKAETESGLLRMDVTEFLGMPLTAGLLAVFVPEFGNLAFSTPLVLRVGPTLAPFVTGQDGPGGEMLDLRLPQMMMRVIGHDSMNNEVEYLRLAFDARIGAGLEFDEEAGSLTPTFGTILPADITVSVISFLSGALNISPASDASLQAFLPQILAMTLPDFSSSIGSFPIPSFLGLRLHLVELRKLNGYITLFTNLAP